MTSLPSSFPIPGSREDFMTLSQVETKMFPVPLQAPSFNFGLGHHSIPQPVLNPSQGPALAMPLLTLGQLSHLHTRKDIASAGLRRLQDSAGLSEAAW